MQQKYIQNSFRHVNKSNLNYCTKTADLRNIFDGNSEFLYYDYGHLQDRGNEIAAENIFELVSPIVSEDVSKRTS